MQLEKKLQVHLRLVFFLGSLALVAAVLMTDRLSGPEVTISVLYLIPIGLSAYYLGLQSGLLIALASTTAYVLTFPSSTFTNFYHPVTYWNVGIRFFVFLGMAFVFARRRSVEDQLTKSEQKSRTYARLHEIDQAILAVGNADAIAQEALEKLMPLISCEVASVAVFNGDNSEARILASWTQQQGAVKTDLSLALEENDETALLLQGKINHAKQDSPSANLFSLASLLPFESLASYANVPLHSQGRLVGSLNFGSYCGSAGFGQLQMSIARQVADQLAVAIHNSQLFEDLTRAHHRSQTLSQALLKVQEIEKHHLARELHDEMGQALTALQIQLEDLAGSSGSEEEMNKLRQSIQIVEETLDRVRNISLDLRPLILDDLGLIAAVRWYISRASQLAGFTVHFESNIEDRELSPELETVLFRVAQEALTNVVRHSRASRVTVEINVREGKVVLIVKDNGVGFELPRTEVRSDSAQSLGLLGMRERVGLVGGKIEIESVPSYGTSIKAVFPLKGGRAEVQS